MKDENMKAAVLAACDDVRDNALVECGVPRLIVDSFFASVGTKSLPLRQPHGQDMIRTKQEEHANGRHFIDDMK